MRCPWASLKCLDLSKIHLGPSVICHMILTYHRWKSAICLIKCMVFDISQIRLPDYEWSLSHVQNCLLVQNYCIFNFSSKIRWYMLASVQSQRRVLDLLGADWTLRWRWSVWMLVVIPDNSTLVANIFVTTWDECCVWLCILADVAFRSRDRCCLWNHCLILRLWKNR